MRNGELPWQQVTLHQDWDPRCPRNARFLADGEARHVRLLHQLREDYLLERLGFCGDGGNGEWRRYRWARIQDPESPGTGWVKLAMELSNAARLTAMELGKIQDKLSSRERSIIKLLPPCLAWLKCHAFWKGLNFIFLSLVIFNSTHNMIPSLQP